MQITLDIPEHYLTDTSPAEFGKSIRLYAALAMFRAGKLSAGAAAEFAEIDRYSFAEFDAEFQTQAASFEMENDWLSWKFAVESLAYWRKLLGEPCS